MPLSSFNYPDLPVSRHREEIAAALRDRRVVVVVGETGSGKTTQLPKIALDVAGSARGILGCTQPRRLAAMAVARRLAEETRSEIGGFVGYQVRFDDRTGPETKLKLMTDGILLAETQNDRDLRRYHTIILDEAHERSLNIDFLLGYMKLLLERRHDLRLIISSATLDAGNFSAFFGNAPVIHVAGRTYPVDLHYMPPLDDQEELPRHVSRALRWIEELDERGDVLVFLPGEREIRETAELLRGEDHPHTSILPLFARLSLGEQHRIFHPSGNGRRIVLATNVAETSLTIPGIVYVIDSGLARLNRYSPVRQVQRLQIEEISQASAKQRAGRCGRVREGVCIRLYDESSWAERPPFTDPEIRRSALAGVILRMADLKLPPLSEFPLPDPPSPKLISEGYRTLREIGAIDKGRELTDTGCLLAGLPLDPRLGRMLLEAHHERCLAEMLVIVSGLGIMDPCERPPDSADRADAVHARWQHPDSDFLSLLDLWRHSARFLENGAWRKNRLRKWCAENFLNMPRILEWHNLREDLSRLVEQQLGWKPRPLADKSEFQAGSESVHRAILAGAPLQFGTWDAEERIYHGAGGRNFGIFPGSGLSRRPKRAKWIMGVELVETTRLWMRRCALFDPIWLEQVAPQLCSHHAHDAQWDRQSGTVRARERVVCGGITLVSGRSIHFGRVNLSAAREIMIREGIMQCRLHDTPPFLRHLEGLREEVSLMENKLRRRDQLWNEEGAFEFFDALIPSGICTEKALRQWRAKCEQENPRLLFIPREAVVFPFEDLSRLEFFPDTLSVRGQEYALYYHDDPASADNGVTLGVHIDQWETFPRELLSWGVPGNLAERAECLLRTLPADLRQLLQPIANSASDFAKQWQGQEHNLPVETVLADFVSKRSGRYCASSQFDASRLPPNLVTKIWVCDDEGKELAFGHDPDAVDERLRPLLKKRFAQNAAHAFSESPMTRWDCGDLPDSVPIGAAAGYPALQDHERCVRVHVFPSRLEADYSHRFGVTRLVLLRHGELANRLKKHLPLSLEGRMALAVLGSRPESNADDILRFAAEGCLGEVLPRSAEGFNSLCRRIPAALPERVQTAVALWERLAAAAREVRSFLEKHADERHMSPIAADLHEQMEWLTRANRLSETGYLRRQDFERILRGISERLLRMRRQPIAREHERLELFRQSSSRFASEWKRHIHDPAWIDYGLMLEEYRLAVFAPSLAVKGRSSAKKLEARFPG